MAQATRALHVKGCPHLYLEGNTRIAYHGVIFFPHLLYLLKFNTKIGNVATCEVRLAVRYLEVIVFIWWKLTIIFCSVWWRCNVRKWSRFKEGRTNLLDEEQSINLPVFRDNLKEKVSSNIRDHRRLKISALYEKCYLFCPLAVWGVTGRQKTCRTGWKAWQWPFSTKAYRNSFNDTNIP